MTILEYTTRRVGQVWRDEDNKRLEVSIVTYDAIIERLNRQIAELKPKTEVTNG